MRTLHRRSPLGIGGPISLNTLLMSRRSQCGEDRVGLRRMITLKAAVPAMVASNKSVPPAKIYVFGSFVKSAGCRVVVAALKGRTSSLKLGAPIRAL